MNQLGLCGWEDLMEEVALCDRTRGPLREQGRRVQKHDYVGEPGPLRRRLSCLLYVKPRVCWESGSGSGGRN